jgi:hypothetical protein
VSKPPTVSLTTLVPYTRSRSIDAGSVGTRDLPALPEPAPRKAATCLILPEPALMQRPTAPWPAARGITEVPGANAAAPAAVVRITAGLGQCSVQLNL